MLSSICLGNYQYEIAMVLIRPKQKGFCANRMCQFLCPEIVKMGQQCFWPHKLTLWVSCWAQKLTLWAKDTLCSLERNGLVDIFQAALKERFEIKLVGTSGTSWLTDGPKGYTEAMQVIFDWSQTHFFKLGQKQKDARSMITCDLFSQPLLPYIKLAVKGRGQSDAYPNC